jgi:peptide/nickel transport system substrate-binding protein
VISNGPFYLESYAPESRTITVKAFEDDTYPFKIGKWSEFENVQFPIIKKIDLKKVIMKGDELKIGIKTVNSDSILYFLTNNEGELIVSENIKVNDEDMIINVSTEKTKKLGIGANNIKIFAMSNSVLKPDYYESSFIVTNQKMELPTSNTDGIEFTEKKDDHIIWVIPIIIIIGIIIYLKKRQSQ